MSDRSANEIGKQIRAMREAAGLSQEQLAQLVETNQQTIQRIESGITQHSRAMPKILHTLRHMNLRNSSLTDELSRRYMQHYDEGQIKKRLNAKSDPEIADLSPRFRMYFATEIDPGLVALNRDTGIELSASSSLLMNDQVYGLYIASADMAPEFEPGDTAIVDPITPPISGVTCLFFENDSGRNTATIKRLISSTRESWLTRSWAPDQEIVLERRMWPECHRIIGRISRR